MKRCGYRTRVSATSGFIGAPGVATSARFPCTTSPANIVRRTFVFAMSVSGTLEHVAVDDDQVGALAHGQRAAAVVDPECVSRVERVVADGLGQRDALDAATAARPSVVPGARRVSATSMPWNGSAGPTGQSDPYATLPPARIRLATGYMWVMRCGPTRTATSCMYSSRVAHSGWKTATTPSSAARFRSLFGDQVVVGNQVAPLARPVAFARLGEGFIAACTAPSPIVCMCSWKPLASSSTAACSSTA